VQAQVEAPRSALVYLLVQALLRHRLRVLPLRYLHRLVPLCLLAHQGLWRYF
jgi:hypothetical protein